MKCPTFDQIDLVVCEDGETIMACAYPNPNDDECVVMFTLDWTMEMVRCGLAGPETLRRLADQDTSAKGLQ